jgi:hypothetical protein
MVEGSVVDRGCGLEVEKDYGDGRSLDQEENGAGKSVGGDVEEKEVGVGGAAGAAGFTCAGGVVDEAEFEEVDVGLGERDGEGMEIAFQLRAQRGKLGPIFFKAYAAEGYLQRPV